MSNGSVLYSAILVFIQNQFIEILSIQFETNYFFRWVPLLILHDVEVDMELVQELELELEVELELQLEPETELQLKLGLEL